MTRAAKFADIPAIVALMQEAYAESRYAGTASEIDVREAKALLVRCLQRHGGHHEGAAFVEVAETAGAIEGFIVGVLDRVYHVGTALAATDLFFFVSRRGDARHAGALMDAFMRWADGCDKVIETQMGATDVVGDWRRTARLYERKGMAQVGVIYRRNRR